MDYSEFLTKKSISDCATGHDPDDISEVLFPFQKDIVRWAIRRGRAAIFADCGLGKTLMQLEWAKHVYSRTGGDILILAPLAVSTQTKREAEKLMGMRVKICAEHFEIEPGINITNYEKLHNFEPSHFAGIVLDESSIIKHHTSKTRDQILAAFSQTPYRLACTATPSPNDYMELGNHSEFLGVMTRSEMLSMYFIHDGGDTSKWRLKGHGKSEFWKWLCSWSVMVKRPSDLGHSNDGFTLPPLHHHSHVVMSNKPSDGYLFAMPAISMDERRQARRDTIETRCKLAADIINKSKEPWVVWCDLNTESEYLKKMITGSIEVKGSDTNQHKESSMIGFSEGKFRVIVTKPSIAGFGMNWQHCNNVAFVGLSDSFEAYYQATRRCWRFGQKNHVHVHLITSELEGNVVRNIKRKELDAENMAESMVQHMNSISSVEIKGLSRVKSEYSPNQQIQKPSFLRD